MKLKKAEKIEEVLQAIQLEPLPPELMSDFYVDCSRGRGYDSTRQVELTLTQVPQQKILLCSHRGSGKSTELNRLVNLPSIKKSFIPIKFSAQRELDLINLSFIDLLFKLFTR
jgi:ABC-type transport system involved in cytochrome bd biosynthesis fused ATPase/permease subunit